jgi:hypothetical protein
LLAIRAKLFAAAVVACDTLESILEAYSVKTPAPPWVAIRNKDLAGLLLA